MVTTQIYSKNTRKLGKNGGGGVRLIVTKAPDNKKHFSNLPTPYHIPYHIFSGLLGDLGSLSNQARSSFQAHKTGAHPKSRPLPEAVAESPSFARTTAQAPWLTWQGSWRSMPNCGGSRTS